MRKLERRKSGEGELVQQTSEEVQGVGVLRGGETTASRKGVDYLVWRIMNSQRPQVGRRCSLKQTPEEPQANKS